MPLFVEYLYQARWRNFCFYFSRFPAKSLREYVYTTQLKKSQKKSQHIKLLMKEKTVRRRKMFAAKRSSMSRIKVFLSSSSSCNTKLGLRSSDAIYVFWRWTSSTLARYFTRCECTLDRFQNSLSAGNCDFSGNRQRVVNSRRTSKAVREYKQWRRKVDLWCWTIGEFFSISGIIPTTII